MFSVSDRAQAALSAVWASIEMSASILLGRGNNCLDRCGSQCCQSVTVREDDSCDYCLMSWDVATDYVVYFAHYIRLYTEHHRELLSRG